MEDKKEYLKDMAQMDWDSGHPFSSDDFRLFQRVCKDDGFDVTREDWNYYWNCFNECKENYYEKDEDDFVDEEYERTHPEFYDPYDGINENELITENYSPTGTQKISVINHGPGYGSSEAFDKFGSDLLNKIRNNLEEMKYIVCGSKERPSINKELTKLSISKDPAPGESVKERKVKCEVYFNNSFDNVGGVECLKQKTIQAIKGGVVDFNDEYKTDHRVVKDFQLLPDFKYSKESRYMYLAFKAIQEDYSGDTTIDKPDVPKVIVHKHTKESVFLGDKDEERIRAAYNNPNIDFYDWTQAYICEQLELGCIDESEIDELDWAITKFVTHMNESCKEESLENIFESVLKEWTPGTAHEGVTTYPLKTSTSTGKAKKVPLVMQYIYENPGCSRQEVLNFTHAMGFTGQCAELFHDMVNDGFVNKKGVGGKMTYYPTNRLIGYLIKLSFINDNNPEAVKSFESLSTEKAEKERNDRIESETVSVKYRIQSIYEELMSDDFIKLSKEDQKKVFMDAVREFIENDFKVFKQTY